MMSKPWTKEEEDRGVRWALNGMDSWQIGQRLGRSALAVERRLGPKWRKEQRRLRKLVKGRR